MSNDTIRNGLIDAINEMTRLLEHCDDPNQAFELRIKIRELFHQLDRVIVATLDAATPQFNEALTTLNELTASARKSRQNIDNVSATITKAAETVAKVEKVIKGVVGVLAIL